MSKLVLIAVGGNALIRSGHKGTAQEQFENAVETAAAVIRLIRAGHRVVLTHGNGPQVGAPARPLRIGGITRLPAPAGLLRRIDAGRSGLCAAICHVADDAGGGAEYTGGLPDHTGPRRFAGSRLPEPDETYRAFLRQRGCRALSRSARLGDCRGSYARFPQSGPFSGAHRYRRTRCD